MACASNSVLVTIGKSFRFFDEMLGGVTNSAKYAPPALIVFEKVKGKLLIDNGQFPIDHEKITLHHEKLIEDRGQLTIYHKKIVSYCRNIMMHHEKMLPHHEKMAMYREKMLSYHGKIILHHEKMTLLLPYILFLNRIIRSISEMMSFFVDNKLQPITRYN